ncbi:MAG: hypothetical protein ACK5JF_01850 [Oscillospiraceae bacterium]
MKMAITEGVGNNIMMLLIGWAFITFWPVAWAVMVVYLVLFGSLMLWMSYKKSGSMGKAIQQAIQGVQFYKEEDERDVMVTQKATYAAYQSIIICLVVAVAALAACQFWNITEMWQVFDLGGGIPIYPVSIAALVGCMMATQTVFCISWCKNYTK